MAVVIFQYHTECIRREDGSEFGIAGMETQVYFPKQEQSSFLFICDLLK